LRTEVARRLPFSEERCRAELKRAGGALLIAYDMLADMKRAAAEGSLPPDYVAFFRKLAEDVIREQSKALLLAEAALLEMGIDPDVRARN
jgi:hypothetical protein